MKPLLLNRKKERYVLSNDNNAVADYVVSSCKPPNRAGIWARGPMMRRVQLSSKRVAHAARKRQGGATWLCCTDLPATPQRSAWLAWSETNCDIR